MSEVCIKCAKCNPICPTFLQDFDELYSPRGYLHLCELLKSGKIQRSQEILLILKTCTLCKACEPLCPIDLPITQIIASEVLQD